MLLLITSCNLIQLSRVLISHGPGATKGGTEAVVESYYSVMKSQKKFSSQSNETLALR